jgi:hypothetical protein
MSKMYALAADLAGVKWCPKPECAFKGSSEPLIVHFARSRYTKRGLFGFLYLAWYSRHVYHLLEQHPHPERWMVRYRRNSWIQGMASDMHVRLPRSLFDYDRAKLREELSEYASRVPNHARPKEEYHDAKQWAR